MEGYFTEAEKIHVMACRQTDTDFHSHDFLEMVYVTEGKAVHTLDGTETAVRKGDYFIIDYGARHKYTTIKGVEFDIINILFKPEFIDKTLKKCRSFNDLINNYLIRLSYTALEKSPTRVTFNDRDGYIYGLITRIKNEYDQKKTGYLELMRCYLIDIIINAVRCIIPRNAAAAQNDCVRYITDYVSENYMNPVTLAGISETLNFSLPYLSRRFKKDMGVSFCDYLQKKRVEQGCRLIANTDKKISEIAGLVGYGDVKFFNAVFKKHLGMTPREFKKTVF